MALAASLKVKRGDATAETAAMGSATVDILLLPSNLDFSRALKFSRGRSRRSAAMRTRGSTLASSLGSLPSARASNTSTARFSCSIFFASLFPGFRERLGIGIPQSRPQSAERAELQLLHSALGLADLPRHFFDALLLHEPQYDYTPFLDCHRIHAPT